jgi:alpha-tubulin suppressor-like RCC1 family protein
MSRTGHILGTSGRQTSGAVAMAAVVAVVGALLTGVLAAPAAVATTQTTVVAGLRHSCALLSSGSIWCWGNDDYGELGNGVSGQTFDLPQQVHGLPAATSVGAGGSHTCAIDPAKAMWCWGDNLAGQLGNGTYQSSSLPVQVSGNLQATQVAPGGVFTCALLVGGTVSCWGRGDDGELGNGTFKSSTKPRPVTGLSGVKAIAAGGYHVCALLTDGGIVKCWGDNVFGELGNNSTTSSDVPVQVATGVTALTAGTFHTCAITNAAGMKCWGFNLDGELGDGTQNDELVPTPVVGLGGAVQQASGGGDHTCAVVMDPVAVVDCWGSDIDGQIGNGTFAPVVLTPTHYLGRTQSLDGTGSGPLMVASGQKHSCVAMMTGTVQCWGWGFWGALGDGSFGDSAVPRPVLGLTAGTQATAEGELAACALTATLGVKCWSYWAGTDTGHYDTAQDVPGLNSIVQITAGGEDACGVTSTGSARCWGQNGGGELANGGFTAEPTPQAMPISGAVQQMDMGYATACAIVVGGSLSCWGYNSDGEVGDGTTTPRYSPVSVSLPSAAIDVSQNNGHTCAVVKKGQVYCWGDGLDGDLGTGNTNQQNSPVKVKGLPGAAVQVVAGAGPDYPPGPGGSTCALMASGAVYCWGDNTYGELGNGSSVPYSLTPVQVSLGGPAIAVTSGYRYFSCALLVYGIVQCWGNDADGELGNGTTGGFSSTPVSVSGIGGRAVAISGMGASGCALLENPVDLQCWGANYFDELGDGNTNPTSDVPEPVQGL